MGWGEARPARPAARAGGLRAERLAAAVREWADCRSTAAEEAVLDALADYDTAEAAPRTSVEGETGRRSGW